MNKYLFLLICIVYPGYPSAADSTVKDSISTLFNKQLQIYPQEKLYVQTDKTYYVGGEDIWFRAHLTDYTSHIPDTISRYIYTELIDPQNTVVARVKTRPREGAYYGYIHLDELLPEGNYQLRSYTRYMEGLGESYLFRKALYIGDPLSGLYRTNAEFNFEGGDENVGIRLQIIDIKTNQLILPKEVRYIDKKENIKNLTINEDSIIRLSCNPQKDLINRMLYIEYDYSGRFHKQFIPIPYSKEEYHVDFFPEGGNFPANAKVRIAFKALQADGLGEIVEGTVTDAEGNEKAKFSTNSLGMGSFYLKAKQGEHLYAICKNKNGYEKKFELPLPESHTLTLQAQWTKNVLNLFIATEDDKPISSDLYLLLQCRGVLLYCQPWDNNKKYLQLLNTSLPSGVLQAILVDQNYNPVSERLIFNLNKADLAEVTIQNDHPSYKSRELIQSGISLKDSQQNPVEGSFAISVTSDKDIQPDTTHTILTTLLLTSELKGYIENPGRYFSENNPKGLMELDQLMLTQGWSRYSITDILKDRLEYPKGQLEVGPEISGTVRSGLGYLNKKAGHQVAITSFVPASFETTETDSLGHFRFIHTEQPDSTRFIVQALTKKGNKGVELTLDSINYPSIQFRIPWRHVNQKPQFETYIQKADEQYTKENGMRLIYLDEVVVKARKRGKSPVSVEDSRKVTQKKIEETSAQSLYILLKTIGDFHVTQDEITWTGGGTPLIVIDEIIFDEIGFIIGMAKDLVEEVEIVKPQSYGANILAGTFGSEAFEKGVLLVTTKARDGGFPDRKTFNKKSIMPLGYQKVKEFYSPRYETTEDHNKVPFDLRTTLYWNPNLQTENGQANFQFYSADKITDYTVTLEGLTTDGKLIRKTHKINIQETP